MARGFEIVTRGSELMTRGTEFVTRRFELVTRVLLFHVRNSALSYKNHGKLTPLCFLLLRKGGM